jgi:hypothetical protein
MGKADAVEIFSAAVAIPDLYAGFGEGKAGRGAGNEPEEFGDDGADEDAFGG